MPHKQGKLDKGHPYIEIVVSFDGKVGSGEKFTALIDTGYSGFVSLPIIAATKLGLQPHTTAQYEMANGKLCDPIPLARAYACCEGDTFVAGVVAISEAASVLVGVEFLRTCGKGLMVFSTGIIVVDEKEFLGAMQAAADAVAVKESPQPPEKAIPAS
jgi:predicted aspartyl protease